jgi:hypothetical protein
VGNTLTQTSTHLVLPKWPSSAQAAHRTLVGFLAVRELPTHSSGTRAIGGFSQDEQPRYITCTVQLQPITDAPNGISVSAAQGSQTPAASVPMGAKASGVPPRSRPV